MSLQTVSIPYQWKNAIVIPVFKNGSWNVPQNYHPISLTCAICCVFENTFADKLYSYLLDHDILFNSQYGFIPGRSSCSQLIYALDNWYQSLENYIQLMLCILTLQNHLTRHAVLN